MPEPTAFFSHFRIKEGTLDQLKELSRRVTFVAGFLRGAA